MKKRSFRIETLSPECWDKVLLEKILSKFRRKKILVVGDVGVDRYTLGSVERISPEAPVPIVLVEEEKLKLGLAANVADNIRALGAIPLLVGVVGKDRGAEDFRALLKASGVKSSHLVVDSSRRTVLKERVVSERQQLLRIDYESQHSIHADIEEKIRKKVEDLVLGIHSKNGSKEKSQNMSKDGAKVKVDGIIVEDYAKGGLTKTLLASIFEIAKRAGIWVAVDSNLKTPPENYRGASILTPNTKEAEHLSGVMIRNEDTLLEAGSRILKLTGVSHLAITRGKEGMALFTRGNPVVRLIPTFAQEVYDVSGAGDTVISVLCLSLTTGASLEDASILGNLAAGIEVGKRGTATVSPDEIRTALSIICG